MIKPVKGFSKLSKEAKIQWLVNNYTSDASSTMEMLEGYWHNLSLIHISEPTRPY